MFELGIGRVGDGALSKEIATVALLPRNDMGD